MGQSSWIKVQFFVILVYIYFVRNHLTNDAIRSDLAIQYTICKKRFGENLNSFNLIIRSKEENSLCTIIDITADVSPRIEQVQKRIDDFKLVFENQEPTLEMGNHCMTPNECDFMITCILSAFDLFDF
jgi:hypothetical protein